jgi:hypothetical protein
LHGSDEPLSGLVFAEFLEAPGDFGQRAYVRALPGERELFVRAPVSFTAETATALRVL